MYYRHYEIGLGNSFTPAVKNIIVATGAVFLLQTVLGIVPMEIFGLVPSSVLHKGFVWQLVSYMFLHGGVFHIFINMFVLWMFGCEIERHWGSYEFYKYYFITGIGAGIFNVLFEPSLTKPIVGASGAIYGLLLAFGLLFPERPILLYFFIPIKAKYFVLLFGALAFFSAFSSTNDGIAHFAHLGGMVIGYLYLRLDWRIDRLLNSLKPKKRREGMRIHRKKDVDSGDFKDHIDAVLDKINEVGYNNLTEEEKDILQRASRYYLNKKK